MTDSRTNAKKWPLLLGLFLLASILLGVVLYRVAFAGPPNYSGNGSGQTTITVTTGDTLAVIGNHLKDAQVVASVDAFIQAANADPKSALIQPGKYTLPLRCSAEHALDLLISRDTHTNTSIVITEGMRTSDVISNIIAKTQISASELQTEIDDPSHLGLPTMANQRVEGFLFPASYDVDGNSSARSVLRAMVTKAKQEHTQLGVTRANRAHLTPYEVIVVASILEAEAQPSDFTKVARVIYNRLSQGMPLQVDATVAYGLGITRPMLTQAQLDQDTPYNSYLHTGLPPTPIGNPGAAAIEAAMNPASGDWLYYVTVNLKTQETKFATNYDTFLQYKDELLHYCRMNPGKC